MSPHQVTVRWSREYSLWMVDGGGTTSERKVVAVREARAAAQAAAPSQLVVYGKDGHVQMRRTFPAPAPRAE